MLSYMWKQDNFLDYMEKMEMVRSTINCEMEVKDIDTIKVKLLDENVKNANRHVSQIKN